jgi:hypothetical protein
LTSGAGVFAEPAVRQTSGSLAFFEPDYIISIVGIVAVPFLPGPFAVYNGRKAEQKERQEQQGSQVYS